MRIPILSTVFILIALMRCSSHFGFGDPGLGDGRERFSVFYSEPGKDSYTMVDKKVDDELVQLIDNAERYMYLAVYNFNRQSVIDAVLRAYKRNIDVRLVGDIDEFYTLGYQAMYVNNINMTLGNATAIQHDKFAVVDDKYVFMGTGNISDTDLRLNNNNWYIIQNPTLVKLYKDEFMQMHNGLFGVQKRQRNDITNIVINNYPLEIYFSPYLGLKAMDQIIALAQSAKVSIHYMIFADTHDELDAALVAMARQKGIPVYGVHDSTFIIGVSEEAPKLYSSGFNNDGSLNATGPFVKWDGNENTLVKGNPTAGGKLHCKTLLVDAGTVNARMATGSFNWSDNAINNNDENVIIVNQPRVVNTIYEQWKGVWGIANDMALKVVNHGTVASAGDIVITEVGWAGASDGSSVDPSDDFVEILNNSAQAIDLSHWAIQWGINDKRNIFPVPDNYNWYYENKGSCAGSPYLTPQPNILCPGQIRLFYNNKPSAYANTGADEQIIYDDQGGIIRNSTGGSLSNEHIKLAGTKNFKLSRSPFKLRLYDKAMNLIDEAGDGGDAPAGLLSDYASPKIVQSMERRGCSAGSGGEWPISGTLPNCNNKQPGNLNSAWFSHKPAEAYNCLSRQDAKSGTSFDGCLAKNANTYSSAGYIYAGEADPLMKRVEALSASEILVTFDSNMTSGAGANKCLSLGALAVAETQDAGNLCAAPTVSSLSATLDPSQVKITLGAGVMVAPTCRYSITATATCLDSASHSANGQVLYANGQSALATAILNEVCITGCASGAPFNSKDWAEIKVTTAGNLRGLKIFYYDDADLRLIYEFSDTYAPAGAVLAVGVQQAAFAQPDRTGTLAFPMAIQVRDTAGFGGSDGTFILTYCALGENQSVDTNKTECALPYKGIQDALYYSNRDGTMTSLMVAGPLTHFYENLQSFWPMAVRPIYGLTDRATQLAAICVAADASASENTNFGCSNSYAGVGRSMSDTGSVRNAGKDAWRNLSSAMLTPAAINTAW
ncbi:MAG: lamin tail domain-containing protein [Spirochaetes bacterium]|nr:lamin tail domain-containing protein [Spirochaetota bacterium]